MCFSNLLFSFWGKGLWLCDYIYIIFLFISYLCFLCLVWYLLLCSSSRTPWTACRYLGQKNNLSSLPSWTSTPNPYECNAPAYLCMKCIQNRTIVTQSWCVTVVVRAWGGEGEIIYVVLYCQWWKLRKCERYKEKPFSLAKFCDVNTDISINMPGKNGSNVHAKE